ncbi:MAG TPA: AAA family ATPase [Verrucomicrobiales bacterium]|nr:AAA family ATPase [Verrucomicrobiales bacterium]
MQLEFYDPSLTHPEVYQRAVAEAKAMLSDDPPEDTLPASVPKRRAPLTLRSIKEILATPDSPADLILANGYVERGERTAICGMGGIGKSRLMMQFAMMHRAGLPFLAWETRSPELRWLFLQTENGNRRLKSDIAAMLTAFTPAQQMAIKDGILVHTLEGEDDGFLLLNDPDNQQRAIDAVLESGADIVVWDPLRDFTSDDLNKDMAMNETLRTIRSITRTGNPLRTCLVIHHAGEGKAGVARAIGYDRGTFGRNSKTLKTWARAQINIAPATPDDNSQIIIASGKCNNFEEFSPLCARLNPDTMLYELVQEFDFDAWRDSLSAEREKPTTDIVLKVLRDAGGGLSKNETVLRLQNAGIGKHTARALIAQALDNNEIEETEHFRSGTRPELLLTLNT